MLARLKQRLRTAAGTWLFRLGPAEGGEVLLSQRRVFIVPTRAGLAFSALLLTLLIGAINYNLSLGFALTFLTGACGLVDMVLTSKNLALLHVAAGRAQPVFAHDDARFELHLINRSKRDRFAIRLDFIDAGAPRHVADVAAAGTATLLLSCASTARGWLAAPRVRLSTSFPLGLFRAWSYWQPDVKLLVYPFPAVDAGPLPLSGTASEQGSGGSGQDDFAGIRAYQPGDPMRHLAWRQIARLAPELGGQLVTKQFEGGAAAELVLDFSTLPTSLDLEIRLSRMTRWVLDAEQRALPYGFRLGRQRFAPGLGEAHRAACLQALALYGLSGAAP